MYFPLQNAVGESLKELKMAKAKLPPSVLVNTPPRDSNMFVSYAGSDPSSALAAYGRGIDKIERVERSTGALSNAFQNIDANTSIKSGFSRLDYEFFRPNEMVPRFQKQIISTCMSAYDKIGIIRNVIDTMSDFASKGVRFTHPNKQIEEFYNSWFKKVNGAERSERFINLLYRCGNVMMKRSRAKLKEKVVQDFKRGIAAEHIEYEDDLGQVSYREIPLRYTFINPVMVDIVAEELSMFTGKYFYKIKMPPKLVSIIQNPRDEYEIGMVASIPTDITDPIKQGLKEVRLSDDDLMVYHYKKDDWQVWANPMTYSIMDDLITLEKMKLADLAALDGAISHIRIWRLGSLEEKILPTDSAIQKLANLLLNNVGGGSMDLIWGPDLQLDETSTDVQKFLGSEKYTVCLMNIYAGLGVPPTMTGSAGGGGSFNNNFISLKTLVERLEYGRSRLRDMWDFEARMVAKAMRFKEPAVLLFDHMNLSDDVAEKALWIQMVDRFLVSEQSVQERFGTLPEIERRRIDKEYAAQQKGKRPPKVSPYHDANPELSLEKIFAQTGVVTPSETGLVLDDRKPGEQSRQEMQQEQMEQKLKLGAKGTPGQGRPANTKDSAQRKRRLLSPSKASEDFVSLSVWAKDAQKTIAEIVNPFFLGKFGKENMRQLSNAEVREVEELKFNLLMGLPAYSSVDADSIYSLTENSFGVYTEERGVIVKFIQEVAAKKGAEPSLDELHQINSVVYAMFQEEGIEENVENSD